MSNINRNKLQKAILDKLDDPLFAEVQATPEELSNYALLNIERNNDLDAMVENLRIFMGDSAFVFCKWLISYVRSELPESSNEAEIHLSVNSGMFDENDFEMEEQNNFRRVNRSWANDNEPARYHKDYISDDEDMDVRRIPSVVTTTRYSDHNRRSDHNFDRGAAHLFLRAVNEANSHPMDHSFDQDYFVKQNRSDKYRGRFRDAHNRGRRHVVNITSNDLRHKINNARKARSVSGYTDFRKSPRYSESNPEIEQSTANNIRTRLTRFEATLTSQMSEVNTPDMKKRIGDTSIDGDSSSKKKKIRCKFWPKCARGDSCQYVHPTENCNLFPECKFGATCLYIHPTCPNDGSCTNTDCKFTHNKIQRPAMPQNPFSLNNKKPATTQISNVCYFDATCRIPNCPRLHPNRTKFTCRSAFKWVNPAITKKSEDTKTAVSTSHISS